MPDIIDLVDDTTKKCPFDNTVLKHIVYFGRKPHLDYDENGDESISDYICTSCGFKAQCAASYLITNIQAQVQAAAPTKAELLAAKEAMRGDRKKHTPT